MSAKTGSEKGSYAILRKEKMTKPVEINAGAALGRVSWVPVNPWISRISASEPVDF